MQEVEVLFECLSYIWYNFSDISNNLRRSERVWNFGSLKCNLKI